MKSFFHRAVSILFFPAMLSCCAVAQDRPAGEPQFEVVTIKPTPPDTSNWRIEFNPGMMWIQNRTLRDIIEFAYDLKSDSQLLNAPEWVKSDHFDIRGKEDAELAKKVQEAQREPRRPLLRQLVRNMLEERFHLKVSRKSVEVSVYALVAGKGGTKAKPFDAGDGKHFRGLVGPLGNIEARGASMQLLADRISDMPEGGGRVVLDKTSLPGEFSWTLRWTPERLTNVAESNDESSPTLFTALQEQLGLKLESQKSAIEAVIIEHIERPTEN
jgi:uncharacterized protein (TIGR03435 family)